jgi:DNA-binding MarR family transcriptional regulator
MTESLPKRQHTVNRIRRSTGRTPAGDAFSALVIAVFRLNGLLAAEGDALARPAGQTSARWLVLAVVENGPATVAQIARILGLARQSVQRVADLLEADGLADFVDNPGHRRAKLLRLTPRGRRTLRKIQTAQRAWADELGGRIGDAELSRATTVLDRVLALLAARRRRR